MEATQIAFLVLLGLFAAFICVYGTLVLLIRIRYLIGKWKGWW